MTIVLRSRVSKTLFLVGCLAVSGFLLISSSRNYFAFYYSEKTDLKSLAFATRLEPGNAEYQDKLGQLLMRDLRMQEAADAFGKATQLNPQEARYWMDLASLDQSLGRISARRDALEHALVDDPTNPDLAWAAGSQYASDGDVDSALKQFRRVLQNSPKLVGSALELCWRMRPDVDSLLRNSIPANADVYSSFLEFLISKGESAPAERVWTRILEFHKPVHAATVLDYVAFLIRRQQSSQAHLVWQQAGGLCDLKNYQPSVDNLVVNGDFSLTPLNSGFDWRYEKQPDVTLLLDPEQPHLGSRSMLISYDSRGLQDSGIHQMISVEPNTDYRFSAYFKTDNLEGAGGPHFLLRDYYTEKPAFYSEELKDAAAWRQVSGRFKTAAETRLLLLTITRVPAGDPIRGKLWIDNVKLVSERGEKVP